MTKQEKIIVSAYTGVLMSDLEDVHEYIEKKLGRPVFTHELTDNRVLEEIRQKTKSDFLAICEDKFDNSIVGTLMGDNRVLETFYKEA